MISKQESVLMICIGVVIIISLLLNGIISLRMIRDWRSLPFQKVLLLSAFTSNFFLALFGYTIPMYALMKKDKEFVMNRVNCILTGYNMLAFSLISIFMIMVLMLHRYFLIKKPLRAKVLKNRRYLALLVCVITWLLGFICALPPVVDKKIAFHHLKDNYHCAMNWTNRSVENITYIIFLLCLAYGLPIFVYVFTYMRGTFNLQMSPNRLLTKRYHITINLMLLFFFISWTPYCIISLMALVEHNISGEIEMYCSLFAKLSSIWGSLLYIIIFKLNCRSKKVKFVADRYYWLGKGHEVIEDLASTFTKSVSFAKKVGQSSSSRESTYSHFSTQRKSIFDFANDLAANITKDALDKLTSGKEKSRTTVHETIVVMFHREIHSDSTDRESVHIDTKISL